MRISRVVMGALVAGMFMAGPSAFADSEYHLTIQDHKFEPTELKVTAGAVFQLIVENKDATPEEFESHDLKREKIVQGNGTIKVNVGPLEPGRYEFYGEFHEDSARGWIVAE